MLGNKTKNNSNVKTSELKQRVGFVLAVSFDVYIFVVLAYSAGVMGGVLSAPGIVYKALWVSLAFFAAVRLVVGIARGHRVVE